jgi:hypothetical protein
VIVFWRRFLGMMKYPSASFYISSNLLTLPITKSVNFYQQLHSIICKVSSLNGVIITLTFSTSLQFRLVAYFFLPRRLPKVPRSTNYTSPPNYSTSAYQNKKRYYHLNTFRIFLCPSLRKAKWSTYLFNT